ncbi:MAG: ABC transporter permease [Acidimicrobiia bacterium]
MLRYLTPYLLRFILILLGVTVLVFLILHLTPGDPARLMLPDGASDEAVAEMRRTLGLDRPLPQQYATYLGGLLAGDLGTSLRHRVPNAEIIGSYLPNTLRLAFAAIAMATLVGVPLGVLAALTRNSVWDIGSLIVALLGQSLSPVVLGPLLIFAFAVRLKWLPAFGADSAASIVLPAITLGAPLVALLTRLTRASVLEVLNEDYVRTARAKGLRRRDVVVRHVMRNAMATVVTVLGLQLGTVLGGAVVTETIFAYPGVGRLAIDSILARDFPLVQSITLIVSFLFVLVNLLVDLSYYWFDPQLRYR